MKRWVYVLSLGLAGALMLAGPALAHEEINPARFKTQTPTFFQLSVANEKKADLTKVVVDAPSGISFGEATRSPTGWSDDRTDEKITWTGGTIKPEGFDNFGFEIEGADKAETITWKVTMSFADGSTDPAVDVVGNSVDDLNSSSNSKPSQGRATAALVLAIVGVVLALLALLRSLSGRSPAGGGKEDSQDW